ncbi:UNVERIFIED_CONTAM: hypothetical protein Slati_1932500 [Sesamum latifolium]|uniref:RNase H type-1 domain-containing protein n=1 Tax=Sesamum latifolium TaxID=2727402 RepID=A0AAW2X7E3_9LAMI
MQVEGTYDTRERTMIQYLENVREQIARFDKCTVQQIPRNENERADALSKFGAMVAGVSRKITIMVKERPAIEEPKELQAIEEDRSWKSDLIRCLKDATLPDDPIAAKRLKFKAARFTMIGEELYKRTISGLLLKCLVQRIENTTEFHGGRKPTGKRANRGDQSHDLTALENKVGRS